MITRFILPLVLAAAAAGQRPVTPIRANPAGGVPPSYKDLKYPPLNAIKIPTVERYTLANGVTIFLVEDHEIPVVNAQALIRAGSRLDPPGRRGLAALTLTVMRTGGTAARSGDELDSELDRLAASVETTAGSAAATGSVFVLREDAEKALAILAGILREPAFPQEKIDLAKIDLRDSVSRRNDSADAIHSRELGRLLYGKTSPYAALVEYADIDAITRQDLISFHNQYFEPENAMLAVWGDFESAAMKALLNRTFGAWPKGGKPAPPIPAVDRAAQTKGLFEIGKEDLNQSTIDVGMLLGRYGDPDFAALRVMTQILGGGFSSRLFQRIRTSEGLAYAAYAAYSPQYDRDGAWVASVGTKSESTLKALGLMREEIAKMRDHEVSAEELQLAKDSILKGEAFDYDSTGKIVSRLLTYEYFGYPADFLQKSRAAVEKVTRADVLRMARQYLQDDAFTTLVLGNPKDFDKPLSSLGAVTNIDISIPPPKSQQVAVATPETATTGRALLDKARAAHGGAALLQVKDYVSTLDMTVYTAQGEFPMQTQATISLTGKTLMKMNTPMGEILQGFDGQNVWMKSPQGVQQLPANAAAQARQATLRELVSLLTHYDQPGYTVQVLDQTTLEGKPVNAVLVNNAGAGFEVRVFLDPATGLLAGRQYQGQIPMSGPGEITEALSDIREAAGVKFPFHAVMSSHSRKAIEQRVSAIQVNTGVPDSVFTKPQ